MKAEIQFGRKQTTTRYRSAASWHRPMTASRFAFKVSPKAHAGFVQHSPEQNTFKRCRRTGNRSRYLNVRQRRDILPRQETVDFPSLQFACTVIWHDAVAVCSSTATRKISSAAVPAPVVGASSPPHARARFQRDSPQRISTMRRLISNPQNNHFGSFNKRRRSLPTLKLHLPRRARRDNRSDPAARQSKMKSSAISPADAKAKQSAPPIDSVR